MFFLQNTLARRHHRGKAREDPGPEVVDHHAAHVVPPVDTPDDAGLPDVEQPEQHEGRDPAGPEVEHRRAAMGRADPPRPLERLALLLRRRQHRGEELLRDGADRPAAAREVAQCATKGGLSYNILYL